MDPKQTWYELIREAEYDDNAPLEPLEEAIREADETKESRVAYLLRSALINCCQERGRPDLILAHYPWCLSYSDKLPAGEREQLLFRYRWAISQSIDYPEIGRQRLEELTEDMSQRYRQQGFSQRSVWVLRLLMARYWHDESLAEKAISEYSRQPRDDMSDSYDTEKTFVAQAQLLFWPGQHVERIAEVQIDSNFHRSHVKSALLLPLLKLGSHDLAERQHQESLRLANSDSSWIVDRSNNATYLGMTGKGQAAASLIQQDLPQAIGSIELSELVEFFPNAAWVLLHATDDRPMSIELSSQERKRQGMSDCHSTADLGGWCRQRAEETCERYDKHASTAQYAKNLMELLRLRPLQ